MEICSVTIYIGTKAVFRHLYIKLIHYGKAGIAPLAVLPGIEKEAR